MQPKLTEREIENSELVSKMVEELARNVINTKNAILENRYLKWLIKYHCILIDDVSDERIKN